MDCGGTNSESATEYEAEFHLIGIHVTLSATASLPHDKREMIVQLSLGYFFGGHHDRFPDSWIETVLNINLQYSPSIPLLLSKPTETNSQTVTMLKKKKKKQTSTQTQQFRSKNTNPKQNSKKS